MFPDSYMDLCFEIYIYIYEGFKVIRLHENVYSKSESLKLFHVRTNYETNKDVQKYNKHEQIEAINIRVNELAERAPG